MKQKSKFSMQNKSAISDNDSKCVGETFIPFVNERDTIGRMFSQTLLNNRMRTTMATRHAMWKRDNSAVSILGQDAIIDGSVDGLKIETGPITGSNS